ncbi:MAG: zf-HC2 domain-containing protein [Elusimicrobiota bacterium]|jgi:hypothetical protein
MKDTSHVHDLLSAFADGELAAGQARAVAEHLSGCPECRERLSELRSLSKMLADLPKRELPAGFIARLKARQARQAAPSEGRFPFFSWNQPVRAAAMALSALVVMFVAYEGLRSRPSRESVPAAPAARGEIPSPKMDAAGLRAAAGPKAAEFRRKAETLSRFAAAGAAAAGASEASAPPAPALAGGAPLGESGQAQPSYTNTELQAMIEAEKKALGITAIVPPQEKRFPNDEEWTGSPNPDRQPIAIKRAPARLEGDTPAMITPTGLQAAAAPANILLAPPSLDAGRRTFSPVRASRGAAGLSALEDASAMAQAAAVGSAAPADDRTFGRHEVLALRSERELDLAWTRYSILLPKPALNFGAEMVVLVPASDEDNSACDILAAEPETTRLRVTCRMRESSYAERARSASFRVVPISPLIPRLETLR